MHINQQIMDLVSALIREGYLGDVRINRPGTTGAAEAIGEDTLCVRLDNGFCKESLHIVANDAEEIIFCGRYHIVGTYPRKDPPTVKSIVEVAWSMYRTYEGRGYGMPEDFRELFVKYGYLTKKTVTKTVYEPS